MMLSLKSKLFAGFGSILLLTAIITLTVFVKLNTLDKTSHSVTNQKVPAALTSQSLLNGVNDSLASLRGYMILGKEKFKIDRQNAWAQIHADMVKIKEIAQHWTDSKSIQKIKSLEQTFQAFQIAQQEIQDISNTPQNTPAVEILTKQAAPLASHMLDSITKMIDIEKTLEATPQRKALLANLADTRGSLATGLASIRAFLLTGDKKFQHEFNAKWKINTQRLNTINEQQSLFKNEQAQYFKVYTQNRKAFAALPQKMFDLRNSENWNIANHWLKTKAAPKGARAKKILTQLVANQKSLMAQDVARLASQGNQMKTIVASTTAVAFILAFSITIITTRSITRPISKAVEFVNKIAKGDLTAQCTTKGKDEISGLINAINAMNQKIKKMVSDITTNSTNISNTATELSSTSKNMYTLSNETNQRSTSVSAAMEEMSINVNNISQSTEEMSRQFKSVAAATEQMNISITEVASNSEKAATIAQDADQLVSVSNQKMTELRSAADEIGKVIEMIQDIAEQTNLLALNATIEAARAGDAGKGFAVVANEVKALSRQTSQATNEISSKILAIQDTAKQNVEAIVKVSTAVNNITQFSRTIASAVEEQSTTTKEIAKSVEDSSNMATHASTMLSEANIAVREVTQNIAEVDQNARQGTNHAKDTSHASENLTNMATDLQSLISQFKI